MGKQILQPFLLTNHLLGEIVGVLLEAVFYYPCSIYLLLLI